MGNTAFIPIVALQDNRLSFKAKGAISIIHALYYGERPSARELAAHTCESSHTAYTCLKELESLGYIEPKPYKRKTS